MNFPKLKQEGEVFVLAEVACTHDGSIKRMTEIIKSVSEAGFDGIQFQLFSTDLLLVPYHPFYEKVKGLEIKLVDWKPLIKLAQEVNLKVFVNPLEVDSVDIAVECGVDAIKVHSSDLSNPEMLKRVINSKLPIVLSTGGSTIEEIRMAVDELKLFGATNMLLMHGFQAYPTDINNSHINFIATLESMFGLPVGFQDHINSESALSKIIPLLAMAKGAVLLEKHVTDCRSRKGTDYESALEITEFSSFINLVNESYLSFGSGNVRSFSDQEEKYRQNFKKTVVSSRDVEKGEVITKDMLIYMRADKGYSPNDVNKIIGMKSLKFINKFETIKPAHIRFE